MRDPLHENTDRRQRDRREASKALWDARDVATFFKASRNWVYQQAELGKIPCVRIGGLLRFDPEKIKALGNGELLPMSTARLK